MGDIENMLIEYFRPLNTYADLGIPAEAIQQTLLAEVPKLTAAIRVMNLKQASETIAAYFQACLERLKEVKTIADSNSCDRGRLNLHYGVLQTIPCFFQFPEVVRSRAFQTVFLLKRNSGALNELLSYLKGTTPGRKRFIDFLLGKSGT